MVCISSSFHAHQGVADQLADIVIDRHACQPLSDGALPIGDGNDLLTLERQEEEPRQFFSRRGSEPNAQAPELTLELLVDDGHDGRW
jgi:hypothetical protein